jgi:hypothetical protein
MKTWWKWHYTLHAFIGTMITILTTVAGVVMIVRLDAIYLHPHTIAGFGSVVLVNALCFGGILAFVLH